MQPKNSNSSGLMVVANATSEVQCRILGILIAKVKGVNNRDSWGKNAAMLRVGL